MDLKVGQKLYLVPTGIRQKGKIMNNRDASEEVEMTIKLPCKVGDNVYWFWCDSEGNPDSELFEEKILYFYFDKDGIGIATDYYDGHIGHYVADGDLVNNVRKIYLNKESALADLGRD